MTIDYEPTQNEKLAIIRKDFRAQVWNEIRRLYDVEPITQAEAEQSSPVFVNHKGELVIIVKI